MHVSSWGFGIMLGLLLVVLAACSGVEVRTLEELEAFASEPPEPLIQSVEQGGFTFTFQYVPTDVLLLNEYRYYERLTEREANTEQLNKQAKQLAEMRDSFDQYHHIRLTIEPNEDADLVYGAMAGGFDTYSAWLQKLLFGLQEYVQAQTPDHAEIPLVDYRMDRNFGSSTSRTFLLVFPSQWNDTQIATEDAFSITLTEFGLGVGNVKAIFPMPFPEVIYHAIPEFITTQPS